MDLLSWMGFYARVMRGLATIAAAETEQQPSPAATQKKDNEAYYRGLHEQYTRSLAAHWNPATESFCDHSGLHTQHATRRFVAEQVR